MFLFKRHHVFSFLRTFPVFLLSGNHVCHFPINRSHYCCCIRYAGSSAAAGTHRWISSKKLKNIWLIFCVHALLSEDVRHWSRALLDPTMRRTTFLPLHFFFYNVFLSSQSLVSWLYLSLSTAWHACERFIWQLQWRFRCYKRKTRDNNFKESTAMRPF